jgi:hypothetical protein
LIDRIRQLYPHLGIGIYALDPGGPVTVETLTPDGSTFQKSAPTATEALEALFGPLEVFAEDDAEQITTEEPIANDAADDDIFS